MGIILFIVISWSTAFFESTFAQAPCFMGEEIDTGHKVIDFGPGFEPETGRRFVQFPVVPPPIYSDDSYVGFYPAGLVHRLIQNGMNPDFLRLAVEMNRMLESRALFEEGFKHFNDNILH